ncbi:MAG: hypothetical protein RMJ00_05735 [Nitrososphaerota archaeon]|nr:hypothetical protein [Candidatus Bathyarchaeota archaeon]MCX8161638.1 hypothetical protein [Candidatus Bathyarchaeota archaeon]MDW8062179.1 hypothetical protein [Nitrososphaerota archaeon]
MVRLGFFLNILFAWLLLLTLSYLTVNVVAGLTLQNGYLLSFIEAVSKALSVAILIVLWLYIWKKLSKLYFEKLLKDRIPASDR